MCITHVWMLWMFAGEVNTINQIYVHLLHLCSQHTKRHVNNDVKCGRRCIFHSVFILMQYSRLNFAVLCGDSFLHLACNKWERRLFYGHHYMMMEKDNNHKKCKMRQKKLFCKSTTTMKMRMRLIVADNFQNDRPCEKESADSISINWPSFLGQCVVHWVYRVNQGQHQVIFAIDLASNSINEAEPIRKTTELIEQKLLTNIHQSIINPLINRSNSWKKSWKR